MFIELIREEVFNGNKITFLSFLKLIVFGNPSRKVIFHYRLANQFFNSRFKWLGVFLFRRLAKSYGVYINPKCNLGKGIKFPHPIGIVIGAGVTIGRNCTIYQNVTIGAKSSGDWKKGKYPSIGDNTTLYAGCVVVGDLAIGSNCIVGANAFVSLDVKNNCVVVGSPSRILESSVE